MTLYDAPAQKSYTVISVAGESGIRRRLLDMGFTYGTKLFIEGAAYKKSTVLVLVRGAFIALRSDAAEMISVKEIL